MVTPDLQEDWRPKHMHGQPYNLGSPECGCYLHQGMNFIEWIYCPLHQAAGELLAAAEALVACVNEANQTSFNIRYDRAVSVAQAAIAKATNGD